MRRPQLASPLALAAALALAGCAREAVHRSAGPVAFALARAKAAPAAREWRSYLNEGERSPLAQIDRGNVRRLQVAWEYASGGADTRAATQMQCNPLVVEGVLYGISPTLRAFALDAATGAELWSFEPGATDRLGLSPSRGLSYFRDGEDERVFFGAGVYVWALDARTGAAIASFGERGRIDLREGLGRDASDQWVAATTPPALYRDLLIIGGRVSEAGDASPGHVRAFDAKTGALRWTFRTIPEPGEPGHETWPADAWRKAGGANAWAGIRVDAARGIAFAPTGSATYDFYGGDRLGDDLYANSLVALDAATGARRWHFQVVRHDVWDPDLPVPPNLIALERDGQRVDAVAQATKSGHVFVFERESGAPLFPIREVPAPPSALPGEKLAATQPLPEAPPPFTRQRVREEDLTQRTPEAHAFALAQFRALSSGEPFAAPSEAGIAMLPGFDGGAEWGGLAWDPESSRLYVNAQEVPTVIRMTRAPRVSGLGSGGRAAYLAVCASCHGIEREGGAGAPSLRGLAERMGPLEARRIVREGRGRMPALPVLGALESAALLWYLYEPRGASAIEDAPASAAPTGAYFPRFMMAGYQKLLDPGGFPAIAPPWGTLTAIDLARGEIAWQVPLGAYPELAAQGLTDTGAESYGGPAVTGGGLVFIAATPDAKLRAFDKTTGELLFEALLPAPGFATPAVYEADGRQFVVVAAGGGKLGRASGDRWVAFALP
jgi:quinoprotein glucose dehydrogenase